MIRQTSITAYFEIKHNGLLSKRRFEVYEQIVLHGPMTASEMIERISEKKTVNNSGTYATRLSELRDMGVIKECAPVKCSVTGHQAISWKAINSLPIKLEKKVSRKDLLKGIKEAVKLLKNCNPDPSKSAAEYYEIKDEMFDWLDKWKGEIK
jgi:hypothetical protein